MRLRPKTIFAGAAGRTPDPDETTFAEEAAQDPSGGGDDAGDETAEAESRRRRPMALVVSIALLAAGTGTLLIADHFDAPLETRVLGGNLPINAGATDLLDISAHNSPTVLRNPVDEANVVVANRIDTPRFSCALHVSFDGGASFSQTPLPVPSGEPAKCYAPDIAFDPDGILYLTFVTLAGRGNVPHAVWLSTSDDGGSSLSLPHKVSGELAFQVRLVADPSVSGRLYATWLQASETATLGFPGVGYPINLSISDDAGRTWTSPIRVSGEARARVVAGSPAVGSGEDLYVLYLDLGEDALDYNGGHAGAGGPPYRGTFQLVLARSTDGGATWTDHVVEPALVPAERFIVFIPPFPSLAVDRDRGKLYAAFHDMREGDPDVYVWTSSDKGMTWGEAHRVNDTPIEDGTSQYLPKIAAAPGGRLDVIYYDRRMDPEDILNEVSFQSSIEGGETFTPRTRLSDRSFDSRVGFGGERGMPDLGSRLGLLSTSDRVFAVWADTRAGTEISSKQDLVRAVVQVSDPPRLPPQAHAALRYGGAGLGLAGLAFIAAWLAGIRPGV